MSRVACSLFLFVAAACSSSSSPNEAPTPEGESSGGPAIEVEGGAPSSDSGIESGAGPATVLFDGTLTSAWKMSTIKNQPGKDDPGRFEVVDGALVSHAGTDLGMLWHTKPTPANFLLELEFRLSKADDNSGVMIRFPDPDSKGYDNTAWVAVDFGFEVQINEPGAPDGAPMHTTGAIYNQADQQYSRVPANPPGAWNTYAIRVEGQTYTVVLNGKQVTRFVNPNGARGLATTPSAPSYIGLQTHSGGNVAFRNVKISAL